MPVSVTANVSQSRPFSCRCDGEGDRAVVGELGGVGEQVEQRLADLRLVGVHRADRRRAVDHEPVAVLLHQRLTIASTTSSTSGGRLERLQVEVHPPGLDLGEVEDVVDQPEQVLAGRVDLLEVGQDRRPASRSSASSWSISE